jgi:pilus assembly protein CpaE
MNVAIVTPAGPFVARLRQLHPIATNARQHWREGLTGRDLPALAEEVADGDVEVVVVGPGLFEEAALLLVATLDRLRPDLVCLLAADPSPTLWPEAMRAGARDVISPDAPDEELAAALERAAVAAAQRRLVRAPAGPTALVASVFSPKGGAGKTTVATNLAVGLAQSAPNDVVLVDLDLQFGGVASALQLTPEHSIADAARSGVALDAAMLKIFLSTHPSGLFVLNAPQSLAEADDVGAEALQHILSLLSQHFRYVIVDTAAGIDVVTLAALERSTDLVLVSTPDVACVRALRRAMDALDAAGVDGRPHFVFNRGDVKGGLSLDHLRSVTGASGEVVVPEHRAIAVAMNLGTPIVQSDPRSSPAKALYRLVERFRATSLEGREVA